MGIRHYTYYEICSLCNATYTLQINHMLCIMNAVTMIGDKNIFPSPNAVLVQNASLHIHEG